MLAHSPAFGSIDLEHLNLAFCYQGALASFLSIFCMSFWEYDSLFPALFQAPFFLCAGPFPPLTNACWARPPGSCVLQGEALSVGARRRPLA